MLDWSTLRFAHSWPFILLLVVLVLLYLRWQLSRKFYFPDARLITSDEASPLSFESIVVCTSLGILALFTLVMAEPSVVQIKTLDQRARDFLIIVDTSRSMRHDTTVRRDSFETHFERKVGAFASLVEDPQAMPLVARYELARESLLNFLEDRGAEDRVGLIYFNDDAHPVSALTPNISFVTQQLASMDHYVNWGTDIAAAMESALNLLGRYEDQNKRAIILLTDAETRFTAELEQQLARVAKEGVSFYLLWITADAAQESNDAISSFLNRARAVGTVFAIADLSPDTLQEIFSDIGHMESYEYRETQRQSLDLTPMLWRTSRIAFLVWLMLMLTVFHPPASNHHLSGLTS